VQPKKKAPEIFALSMGKEASLYATSAALSAIAHIASPRYSEAKSVA
jgi:hypothetical protein